MFSGYGGISSRSKSTTDIFRASSGDLDNASYSPAHSYEHFRKNSNSAAIANSRLRRIIAAPIPPRRSSSSLTVNLDLDSAELKCTRSYLTDDADNLDVTVLPTQLTQSPGSKNFVKKLVATLERRQREQQQLGIAGPAAANSELLHKKSVRNTVPGGAGSRTQELANRDHEARIARFNSDQAISRLPATQLEDLRERDEDEDEDWCDTADLSPQFWERDKVEVTTSLPIIHIIERNSDSNNNNNSASKSGTVKRTIKNVLSSIMNWKNSKSLPKGSREYYAARESLGEEMRTFRRDTMPRLMERATGIKGKFDRKRAAAESDDQREFSELIGSPSSKENSLIIAADAEPPSIATIHPVYGSNSSSSSSSSSHHQRRSWHKQDFPADHHGSVKVEPPKPPPRASQLLMSPSAAPAELHLLRDLQKHISRESYSQVQLRQPFPASNDDNNNNNNRNSIVYDVPQSNRRVESAKDITVLVEHERVPGYISRSTPPEYENVSGIIGAHDDDKRLHCTAFTTF